MKYALLALALISSAAQAIDADYLDAACEGNWPGRYITSTNWEYDCEKRVFVPVGTETICDNAATDSEMMECFGGDGAPY